MPVVAQIVVTLTEDGKLAVQGSGPHAANRLMLLGMLEQAKASMMSPAPTQDRPPIFLAKGPFVGHGHNGQGR